MDTRTTGDQECVQRRAASPFRTASSPGILISEHVHGYASDYPHGESHFPASVSLVLD
jgi:hypothetical protein